MSETTGVTLKEGKTWSTDIKKKIVYYVGIDLRNKPFIFCKGLLLHEISHVLYTTGFKENSLTKKNKTAWQMIVNACEDMRIERQIRVKYEDFAIKPLDTLNTSAILPLVPMLKAPKLSQFMYLLSIYNQSMYNPPIENVIGYGCSFLGSGFFAVEVTDRFFANKDILQPFRDTLRREASTQTLFNLIVKELYPIIKDWIPDFKEPPNGKGKACAKSLLPNLDKANPTKVTLPTEKEATAILMPYARTLAQRLRNILQETAQTRHRGNYLSGKLLSKNVYKVAIDGENRIFSKKTNPDTLSYKLHIALDASGSMRDNNKAYFAFMGACMLKEVARLTGFDCQVYYYNSEAYKLDKLDDYMQGGGTRDSAVLDLIAKNSNIDKQNLIFILTDGYTTRETDFTLALKEVNKYPNHLVGVGIGLSDDTRLKENYPNALAVSDIPELPQQLIGLLGSIIHR